MRIREALNKPAYYNEPVSPCDAGLSKHKKLVRLSVPQNFPGFSTSPYWALPAIDDQFFYVMQFAMKKMIGIRNHNHR